MHYLEVHYLNWIFKVHGEFNENISAINIQFNSIGVKEHTLYDLNILFMASEL